MNWLQRLILGDPHSVLPAPAEMPSDEQLERWKSIASHQWRYGGPPVSHRIAQLAFAEGRRQAQSLQIPPPWAEPFATDEELKEYMDVWKHPLSFNDARRALYARGRADERTAILRALGVEP